MPDTLQKHVVLAGAVELGHGTLDTTDVCSGGAELGVTEV